MAGPTMAAYLKYRKQMISKGDIPLSFNQWKKNKKG